MKTLFLADQPLYGENVEIGQALLISLVAVVIVFVVLVLIIFIISMMQKIFFAKKANVENEQKEEEVQYTAPVKPSIDENDEDMMAAALVATIDYASETKKDVRLKSIKRIE